MRRVVFILALAIALVPGGGAEAELSHPGDCNYGPAGPFDHTNCWIGGGLWVAGLNPQCSNEPGPTDPSPIHVTVEQHGPASEEKVIFSSPCPPGQGWNGEGFLWNTISKQQDNDGHYMWGTPGGIGSWRPNSPGGNRGTHTLQFCASTIQRFNVPPPSLAGSGN